MSGFTQEWFEPLQEVHLGNDLKENKSKLSSPCIT